MEAILDDLRVRYGQERQRRAPTVWVCDLDGGAAVLAVAAAEDGDPEFGQPLRIGSVDDQLGEPATHRSTPYPSVRRP